MSLVNIFKSVIKKHVNYVLASYESEYTPRILSNHNKESKYYIMKLGEVKNDEIVPFVYSDKYMCMPEELDFNLYAIKTNGILTELFSGEPVSVNYNQPYNFEDLSLEELKNLESDKRFYVYNLEGISKKEMVDGINDLIDNHMLRYYGEIFKTESITQKDIIKELIEKKKTEKILEK